MWIDEQTMLVFSEHESDIYQWKLGALKKELCKMNYKIICHWKTLLSGLVSDQIRGTKIHQDFLLFITVRELQEYMANFTNTIRGT